MNCGPVSNALEPHSNFWGVNLSDHENQVKRLGAAYDASYVEESNSLNPAPNETFSPAHLPDRPGVVFE